jgi:hypothetical protein
LAAFDQSHAEVTSALALTNFVNWNDARMIEAGGSFRFQAKALEVRLRGPLAKANDF